MFPKLVQVSDAQCSPEINVEGKGYITVDMGRNPRANNLYWQLVDPVFSLLELGFERPSGRLINCAVPLFKGEIEDCQTQILPNGTAGTPFFDLSPWPVDLPESGGNRGHHIKQAGRIRLLKSDGLLSIVIKDSHPFQSLLYAGKIICNFGKDGTLLSLGLKGSFRL
jgi:hypothetical protein